MEDKEEDEKEEEEGKDEGFEGSMCHAPSEYPPGRTPSFAPLKPASSQPA